MDVDDPGWARETRTLAYDNIVVSSIPIVYSRTARLHKVSRGTTEACTEDLLIMHNQTQIIHTYHNT
jgi:hypothetical protein